MGNTTGNSGPICPFWSVHSLKCKLCSEGLFIPLDDHIDVYCTTPAYPQCLQYSLYAESQAQALAAQERENENRRKYRRIQTQHKVTLVQLKSTGEIASHFATIATTLDVSMGGMRLSIEEPLLNDISVQFSFADFFPESLQSGVGQIAWCNKQIDAPGYQAGLAFQGERIAQAMGLYLGLHNGTLP